MSLVSVVHDYSILYSNRIIQKDKRWADGRLRFYEFNNKMEVYSDEQFLLASDFYPSTKKLPIQSGAFEEGSEFKLPSGKLLVSVQEYLGCSVRDVSKVFKKADRTSEPIPTTYIKKEISVKSEKMPNIQKEVPLPKNLSFLKTEPRDSVAPSPKPRRIGLTRTRSKAKKQSDLSSFTRGPSVESRLQIFVQDRLLTVIRIPPRSANLYTRLYRELAMGEEELDKCVKVPHTGFTQQQERN